MPVGYLAVFAVLALFNMAAGLKADMEDVEMERLREVLTKVLNAGTWYRSALEIDLYEQPYSGEELEAMIREVLSAPKGAWVMEDCPYCFGEHEPDGDEHWVHWKDKYYYRPFLCLCCGKETCARQWAYGRTCGLCDTGICQTDTRYSHPRYDAEEYLATGLSAPKGAKDNGA
jgi:hypothetical protein